MDFVRWDDEIPNMMGKLWKTKKCSKPPTSHCGSNIEKSSCSIGIDDSYMGRFPQTIVLNDQRVEARFS